ncbi:adenine phosphoribosyltransferase [Moraxella nasovis]|uniref:adenine phosphoribosyltransferase n=1 Tax=Moraxella nasovis TaxID=2904121 RepID=UPI001F61AEB7|nr:adenine phosphoribosyltransferase [Moraxella nasovis]UNU73466.1 adenine phosphoribosyltransferase [Moraxella nasovis]
MKSNHPFWQIIHTIPNFPKEGIDFYDITPLLYNHVSELIDALLAELSPSLLEQIDCFAVTEARGFVIGSLLSGRTGKPLMLIRKKGKLPPPVFSESYGLEYGEDTLEIKADLPISNVLLVDDVLATGGTLKASKILCQKAGHTVLGALVLLDLTKLHGDIGMPSYHVMSA